MDRSIKQNALKVMIHLIAWVAFLYLLTFVAPVDMRMNRYIQVMIQDLFFVALFYLNFLLLVPHYLIHGKYVPYIIMCAGLILITTLFPSILYDIITHGSKPPELQGPQFEPPPVPPNFRNDMPGTPAPYLRSMIYRPEFNYVLFVSLFLVTLSLGIRILQKWQHAEKERASAELAYLKAQINPHFLFNTLNSIQSMVVNKSDKTPAAIEVFSDIMRFVIYETRRDYITLSKKIEYINNYITLQKLRLPDNVEINYTVNGDPGTLVITPLIMMPFIENAFKHGVSAEKYSPINIDIKIEKGELYLNVSNRKHDKNTNNTTEMSKLGIENTLKRLKLIYPSKHIVKISEDEKNYYVYLNLKLI